MKDTERARQLARHWRDDQPHEPRWTSSCAGCTAILNPNHYGQHDDYVAARRIYKELSLLMPRRCEDFPACGHYDPDTYESWCPNEKGQLPCVDCGQPLTWTKSSMCPSCYRAYADRAYDDDFGDFDR